jgi:hypothetical protein
MAYVVRRPRGAWEIRESVATPSGPRARTLASFRRLTPAVVDRAVRAASRPTSRAEIEAAARRAGATTSVADDAARTLAAELANGRMPTPGLRRLLIGLLSEPPKHDVPGGGIAEWLRAADTERGQALAEVLSIVDAMPPRTRPPALPFPPLRTQAHARS